jgi:hypothetical protein
LTMNLPPMPNPDGLFWCCGDCWPFDGKQSLSWMPPDQKRGHCRFCGRDYYFASRYGEDELVAELAREH